MKTNRPIIEDEITCSYCDKVTEIGSAKFYATNINLYGGMRFLHHKCAEILDGTMDDKIIEQELGRGQDD